MSDEGPCAVCGSVLGQPCHPDCDDDSVPDELVPRINNMKHKWTWLGTQRYWLCDRCKLTTTDTGSPFLSHCLGGEEDTKPSYRMSDALKAALKAADTDAPDGAFMIQKVKECYVCSREFKTSITGHIVCNVCERRFLNK